MEYFKIRIVVENMDETIRKYDENWPKQFDAIASYLKEHIYGFMRIEHIGSTSIPGMDAKPIIDIDIEISSRADFAGIKKSLEHIGYSYEGNQGIEDREVFKRIDDQNSVLDQIKHHLYVCTSESKEFQKHLLFRDVLRNNKELMNEYMRIKHEIIQKVGKYNRNGYVEMKENEYKEFFKKVLE